MEAVPVAIHLDIYPSTLTGLFINVMKERNRYMQLDPISYILYSFDFMTCIYHIQHSLSFTLLQRSKLPSDCGHHDVICQVDRWRKVYSAACG